MPRFTPTARQAIMLLSLWMENSPARKSASRAMSMAPVIRQVPGSSPGSRPQTFFSSRARKESSSPRSRFRRIVIAPSVFRKAAIRSASSSPQSFRRRSPSHSGTLYLSAAS